MNLLDLPVAEKALSHPLYQEAIDHFGFRYPDYSPIEDGQVFDLGGLELIAYHFPGHTPGEIVLLDKEDRILFSGDGVIEQLWLQTQKSLPIATQIESMMKIKAYRDDFDTILSGHSRKPEDATLFDSLLNGLIDLKNGNTKNDVDYEWWGGVAKAHQYGNGARRIIYPIK